MLRTSVTALASQPASLSPISLAAWRLVQVPCSDRASRPLTASRPAQALDHELADNAPKCASLKI